MITSIVIEIVPTFGLSDDIVYLGNKFNSHLSCLESLVAEILDVVV